MCAITHKNETQNCVNTYDVNEFRISSIKSICYQEFKRISGKILNIITQLWFTTYYWNFLLDRTIEMKYDAKNLIFIWECISWE
jgi:hypothetical protein